MQKPTKLFSTPNFYLYFRQFHYQTRIKGKSSIMPRNSFDLKPPNAVQATREEMSDFNALITRLYQEKYNEYGAVKVIRITLHFTNNSY